MSEPIGTFGGLDVTSFAGGAERGPCLQFEVTGRGFARFAQLTAAEVRLLVTHLSAWLREKDRAPSDFDRWQDLLNSCGLHLESNPFGKSGEDTFLIAGEEPAYEQNYASAELRFGGGKFLSLRVTE